MKAKDLIMLFLLIIAGNKGVWGQNGSFEDPEHCTPHPCVPNTTCCYIGSGCIDNWEAFRGTPDVIAGPAAHGAKYAVMWAFQNNGNRIGESMFWRVPIQLKERTTYQLCFWVRNYSVISQNQITTGVGNIHVRLAQGLSANTPSNCGESLPFTTGSTLLIDPTPYPQWTRISISITVNTTGNYQILFFPESTGNNNMVYWMNLDAVSISQCDNGTLCFINNNSIPVGIHQRNYILAGSSGSSLAPSTVACPGNLSGFMVNNSDPATILRAERAVDLRPNLNADIAPGSLPLSYFLAEIGTCDGCLYTVNPGVDDRNEARNRISNERYHRDEASPDIDPKMLNTVIEIYPNPADNMINVVRARSEGQPLKFEIIDNIGRIVYSNAIELENTSVNTSGLAPGIYHYNVWEGNHIKQKGKIAIIR
jgi:hypothetical protein